MGQFEDIGDQLNDDLFFNTDIGPGFTVEFAPLGEWSNKQNLVVVPVEDSAIGSNEVRGDGQSIERLNGRTIRDSMILEVKADGNPLQEVQTRTKPDLIKAPSGVIYRAVRIVGRDSLAIAYLFVSTKDVLSRGQGLRG